MAGLSQLYKADTSSITLHRAAAADVGPVKHRPGLVLSKTVTMESNLSSRQSSKDAHDAGDKSCHSPVD